MRIKRLTSDEFEGFTKTFPIKSIYQTKQYGSVMDKHGYTSMYIGLVEEEIIAACLILIKKESGFKYGYIPRGFLIDYNDFYLVEKFTKLIKEYLFKENVIAVKVNPLILRNIYDFKTQKITRNPNYDNIYNSLVKNSYTHLGYNNFFEALKPRFEAIIDLSKPLNYLFYNIKKEYRTKIRSSIECGIKVYKGDESSLEHLYKFTKNKYEKNLDYFKNCYNEFNKNDMIDIYYTNLDTNKYLEYIQKKLVYYEQQSNDLNMKIFKYPNKNQKYINKKINIDKLLDKYKNDLIIATKLLREHPNNLITSCVLTIKQDKNVTILIDGYDEAYKSLNSKHLLIWELIRVYQSQGFTKFNLGGMSNVTIDSNKYIGLNKFKLNFDAKMYEYIGDFELVTNKKNYNMYRNYVPLKNLIKSKLVKNTKK